MDVSIRVPNGDEGTDLDQAAGRLISSAVAENQEDDR
jgi:hypothetical protein